MATTKRLLVKDLHLDLSNFRTVKQKNEINAINAMISISPDNFWALMKSLLEDGYLPTENIIVLKDTADRHVVKEGNRRVACLKIILGLLDRSEFTIPADLVEQISTISDEWKKANNEVPCSIYDNVDSKIVDRIVALAHGKGEKASRDRWESVATARHNREMGGSAEPGLDLLEKYLKDGRNLTGQQKERWAGNFPLSILDEAIRILALRMEITPKNLVKSYPSGAHRHAIEELIRQIGVKVLQFPQIRDQEIDYYVKLGFPAAKIKKAGSGAGSPTPPKKKTAAKKTAGKKSEASHPVSDPRSVRDFLKKFNPKGTDRQKIATLRDEALSLNLENNPIAFCFILRSMFEISAKIYCPANGIPLKKPKNQNGVTTLHEKKLLDLLKEVVNHLTNNKKDKARTQLLHGAITELGKSEGVLSVTSLNQLVHNSTYTVTSAEVSTVFGRVSCLLEFMNS